MILLIKRKRHRNSFIAIKRRVDCKEGQVGIREEFRGTNSLPRRRDNFGLSIFVSLYSYNYRNISIQYILNCNLVDPNLKSVFLFCPF